MVDEKQEYNQLEDIEDIATRKTFEEIDKWIQPVDVKFSLKLDDVSILFTDAEHGQDKPVLDMGCEYQTYSITKVGEQTTIKACGWKIGVYKNTQQVYNYLQKANGKIEAQIKIMQ